jgi:hypothetical protein
MDKATIRTYLEMLRVVKFVIDTKIFCLKILPENKIKNWSLHVFCDSDWAGDSEKKESVLLDSLFKECASLLEIKGLKRSDTL